MGFLSKMFSGDKQRNLRKIEEDAQALLKEVAQMAALDPMGAAKKLRKAAGSDLEALFDFDEELHEPFVETALTVVNALRAKQGLPPGPESADALPSVDLADDTETFCTGLVLDKAAGSKDDVIYVRCLEHWDHWIDTLLSVEALCEMAGNERVAAVFVGEEYVLMRREVLIKAIGDTESSTPVPEMVRIVGDWFEEEPGWEMKETVTPHGYDIFVYRAI